MAGRPHWFVHHMGLGETIGYGTRLSMNNSTLYRSESNKFTRAIYISLLGDPSLRMDPVSPPAALSATTGGGNVQLNWAASPDVVLGYHVYRSASSGGPFVRLNDSLVSGTSFTDASVSSTSHTYMVRAVKLQTTPSGTYFSGSQGIFAAIDAPNSGAPISVVLKRIANALMLTWNSQPDQVYRVLNKANLSQTNWTDVSGNIFAAGSNMSWTNTNISLSPQRFYRIASP